MTQKLTQPQEPMPALFMGILAKHGPIVAMLAVITAAFYGFTLKPMADDRVALLTMLQQHLIASQQTLAEIAETNKQNAAIMGDFTNGVDDCHQAQSKALAEILQSLNERPRP